MGEDAIVSEDRAKIYELCASLFAKEPTVELLRVFQLDDNEALLHSHGIDLFADIKSYPLQEQAALLAVEYARLFILPARPAFLQESLQRGEERLWGKATVEVNNLYKRFGFELDNSFKDTPDHLSAELAFLAELSRLESKYLKDGLTEAGRGVLKVKRYFLDNHLLSWFSKLKEQVCNVAQLSYYREITRFLGMILDGELENLGEDK